MYFYFVIVKKFNFKTNTYDIPGKGKCILTSDSFTFEGVVDDMECKFSTPMKEFRALAFSANEEFECYFDEELYYFYPKTNRQQCAKWALIVDELVKGVDSLE